MVERIIEAAGYELALVTKVKFAHHTAPGVYPFWVPDRLWRGKLPECFVKVHLDDDTHYRGTRRFDLRKRPQRKRMYEMVLHRGQPEEMIDWIDGALLVDLWEELKIPQLIRHAWDPVVELAGHGHIARPWYDLPASPAAPDAITGSRASSQHEPPPRHDDPRPG